MTYFFGLAFAAMTAAVAILGDFLLKLAADRGHPGLSVLVLAGIGLYGVSALCWFWSMRHISLIQAGVACSMLSLLALAVIGVLWFDEVLGLREGAGIACALAATVLLSRLS